METIQQQLEELNKSDLNKSLCVRCLASGLTIKKSLWDKVDMALSPSTKELICSCCFWTEYELGHNRIPRDMINYVHRVKRAFEDYRD